MLRGGARHGVPWLTRFLTPRWLRRGRETMAKHSIRTQTGDRTSTAARWSASFIWTFTALLAPALALSSCARPSNDGMYGDDDGLSTEVETLTGVTTFA